LCRFSFNKAQQKLAQHRRESKHDKKRSPFPIDCTLGAQQKTDVQLHLFLLFLPPLLASKNIKINKTLLTLFDKIICYSSCSLVRERHI